ncbi:MAG TPA: XdhC family protein [Allosphingosinicella sp.]|uniref:XdhC family protein n=1 Tax=Allosphingosinicella sp. TaxID=2823234 RepID=UPI002ED8CFE5
MQRQSGAQSVRQIFSFLRDAQAKEVPATLVTVVGLSGSSTRALGTHMAVAGNGSYAGSFSGGCIEAAVVAEALDAIAEGKDRTVRFGAGSPFIDVRLPCGGGVDLLIQPQLPAALIADCMDRLNRREPLKLLLRPSQPRLHILPPEREETGPRADDFLVWHAPDMKLVIAGNGEESLSLAQLASVFGADILLLSPDEQVIDEARVSGFECMRLTTPSAVDFQADPWTAIILLFHDHDWEPHLLERALHQPVFYIGAMGSKVTHEARLQLLSERGLDEAWLARIRGPIGLIPAARDPSMLALSALAEIAAEYRKVAR